MNPEDLYQFMAEICGTDEYPLLLAKDPGSPIGWRPWTDDDARALCDWLSAKTDPVRDLVCYRVKDTAKLLGVSVPKLQSWLRRRDHPVPHIRDDRIILIPNFLLMEWLREESDRSRNFRG